MGMIKEFKAFAMRGNVVDLAVGVIIGGWVGVKGNFFYVACRMMNTNGRSCGIGVGIKTRVKNVVIGRWYFV